MYITVNLLNGYARLLTYSVPESLQESVHVGSIVHVPLQKRVERALVYDTHVDEGAKGYLVRHIIEIEQLPLDNGYHNFIRQVSKYYAISPVHLYRRLHQIKTSREENNQYHEAEINQTVHDVTLTTEQQNIVQTIATRIDNPCYYPALIYGATGSGKTEIYIRLMEYAFQQNKTTLLLLPEVSLAIAFSTLLCKRFSGKISVFDYHSATSTRNKQHVWRAIAAGEPIVIVGVHVPVLLPLSNLGMIIIDEEHDSGFQEKRNPRLNTKEIALMRAQGYKIPLIMGSATPSLSSLHAVKTKGWHLFRLTQRFSGSFPHIIRASLSQKSLLWKEPEQRWITDQLHHAISQRLARQEQTIIFLNRRGLHNFVQCSACSYLFSCHSCSVTLTLHTGNQLICHYCGIQMRLSKNCPSCPADEQSFLKKGIGTQRLVELLSARFPTARIARADTDTTREKRLWNTTVTAMLEGNIDILVGTQTVTKGYHFPRVTLVGVIWAESNLSIPFYNATEVTLQQLIQVSGRAGRSCKQGEVIIQSFIEHPVFSYLREEQYLDFYEYEQAHRSSLSYPPSGRLSAIELIHEDENILDHVARATHAYLKSYCESKALPVVILGPSLPPVHRIQKVSTRRIYLKSNSVGMHLELFHAVRHKINIKSVWFHPNPLQ